MTLAAQLEQEILHNRLIELPVEWADELVFPAYQGLSLYNIPNTITDLLGTDEHTTTPLDSRLWQGETLKDNIQRVIIFLTDGAGYRQLQQIAQKHEKVAELINKLTDGRGMLPLSSVAPSTTCTALPTFWTGRLPVEHGMVGTRLFLRETGMFSNILHFKPDFGRHTMGIFDAWGLEPEQFLPVPGLAQNLQQAGVDTHLLLPKELMKTGLSRILHRGVTHEHIHAGFTDLWPQMHNVLSLTTGQRAYVSIYWPAIDSVSHMHGAHSDFVVHEIQYQLEQINQILESDDIQDGQTLFMLIADHGHHDIPNTIKVGGHAHTEVIADAVRMVGGENRFSYLYLRNGYRNAVKEILSEHFSDCLTWIEPQKAIESGLYGISPVYQETPHRLGDLIVISRLNSAFYKPGYKSAHLSKHGGLSEWEMLIPMLWKTL